MPGPDWSLLNTPNFASIAIGAQRAGREERREAGVTNALELFRTDPIAGARAMAAVDPARAANLVTTTQAIDGMQARATAKPFLDKGDYQGAGKAVAGVDPRYARELFTWDAERLDQGYKKSSRSAQVLMAGANLADPAKRKAYILEHADELQGMGYTPEQLQGYDTTDPAKMRADAGRFMGLAELAGKISTEKFGDYAVTTKTDPINGSVPVSKTLIPPTRSDQRQDAEFAYRKSHDAEELDLRRQEAVRRAQEANNPESSPSKVMGPIFAKIAKTGEASLTPSEKDALRYYNANNATKAAATGEADADYDGRGQKAQPQTAPQTGRDQPITLATKPDPSKLIVGQVYRTPKGVGRWNGSRFVQ